jgi:DNA-binding NarL/FixJ family response regulator
MNRPQSSDSGSACLSLLVIAPQPLVRLGLRIALGDWATIALELDRPDQAIALDLSGIAVAVVQWSRDRPEAQLRSLDRLVQVLGDRPLLVIGDLSPPLLNALQQIGVAGCCGLETPPETLRAIVERLALGDRLWLGAAPRGPWWSRQRQSNLAEIDAQLGLLQQQSARSSRWDRLWIAGQCRELRAARWMLALPESGDSIALPSLPATFDSNSAALGPGLRSNLALRRLRGGLDPGPNAGPNAGQLTAPAPDRSTWELLVTRTASLVGPTSFNLSSIPLEIDALNPSRRQALLALVLQRIGIELEGLRQSRWAENDRRLQVFLQGCWRSIVMEFYGRDARVPTPEGSLALVPPLLDQEPIVAELLRSIYGVDALLGLVLAGRSMTIDGLIYPADDPAVLVRSELYLHNLVIQLANAVVYPLLNRFPEDRLIQQTFWDPRLFSTREIERFRNSLSWYHRVTRFIQEPRDIYESRRWLLTLQSGGIQTQAVYAPRRDELAQLSALQQGLALTIEIQDAASPHVRQLSRWLGRAIVYLLTQIVGRGLGLIGRGILQGIGQSFGDRGMGIRGVGNRGVGE